MDILTRKETERMLFQLEDLIEHKRQVLASCKKMAEFLIKEGNYDHAKDLIKRAAYHDNSKLEEDEFGKFLELKIKDRAFTNAKTILNDYEKERIAVHWKKNPHHPEYYESPEQMTTLDRMEMVCDWHARSRQYGTDLLEFAETRQKNRFHFPEEMFLEIMGYCRILISE